ncbi:hypothetical protein BM523_03685 [Alteromonas mediterranea]|uniref:nidogen-like domain-containing protein n=1 Tax=Alteromonas mediterranea TaxID=314275 RepID=UPI000903DE97|nr:nidogen-like domain-containing protein [Alteromonas mediterranea]APD93183.1 hypothetical protein BM523_03685 [Alteromonas mediterranea]APD96796.1 hypothetical protein BM525_03670 [Alteromonas mediterranea]QGX60863.1 PEP-CTERM sorting domain-containing protein [Alteromonas mediterranea]
MKWLSTVAVASLTLASFSFNTQANIIIGGMGGLEGYGTDETYTEWAPEFNLPFEVKLGDNSYEIFRPRQYGTIAFLESASLAYNGDFIAPFTATGNYDCFGCGQTYIGSPQEGVVAVTWSEMSTDAFHQESEDNRYNTFQALLIDRSDDTGQEGDFDVEFRYQKLEYREAEEDSEYTPASQAGVSTSTQGFISLPGSGVEEILELAESSNVGETGIWVYNFRDGVASLASNDTTSEGSGTSVDPFMPTEVVDGGWEFDFSVEQEEQVFIDPDVAIGYDYVVESGPKIGSVYLPSGFDADYELWLMGNNGWEFESNLLAEEEFLFGSDGVSEFRILGIDTSNMINPEDDMAFVTGLTFVDSGNVVMTQTPITEFVAAPTAVSEPSHILLFLTGVGFISLRKLRKQSAA